MTTDTTVACVLRSGGDYSPRWVWALQAGVREHWPGARFVCLTDTPDALNGWGVPLEHDWTGWWSKLELFRPGLFDGPVLFLDLDTLVLGDLSDLAGYRGAFCAVEDFYREGRLQSSVMAWTPSETTEALYHTFASQPVMEWAYRYRSDQEFIEDHLPGFDTFQALYPGQVMSLKVHCLHHRPEGARLVCGHGQPRFSDPAANWAHEHWRALAA